MPEKPKPFRDLMKDANLRHNTFTADEAIRDLVKKYNEEYIHWDELRRKALPVDPEIIWVRMKMSRESECKHLKLVDIPLSYNTTNRAQRVLHILDTQCSGMVISNEQLRDLLKEPEKKRYIISSLMEEAIASSQLEGAVTTTRDAKRMLRNNSKPRSKSEQMILNDYLAMQRIKEIQDEPLTEDIILEIHKILTHNTLEKEEFEGRFREDNDTVVGDPFEVLKIYHTPPDHAKIQGYIQGLCEFANQDSKKGFQHPLVKAIIIHFAIGYVHPFIDGNGRLARALMYWYALKRKYWLFEYMAVSKVIKQHRGKYGQAYLYAETDNNDITYFINYNLECMEIALDNTRRYLLRKQEEQQEAMKLLETHKELSFRQAELLKDMIKHKGDLVSIREVMSKFNVVNQTARMDLLFLTKLGFLEKKMIGNKLFFTYRGEGPSQGPEE